MSSAFYLFSFAIIPSFSFYIIDLYQIILFIPTTCVEYRKTRWKKCTSQPFTFHLNNSRFCIFTLKAIRRLSGDDTNLVAIACKTMNTIFYTEKEREEMIQSFREEVTKWENLLRQLEGNGTRIVTLLKESKYFIDIR